MVSMFLIWLLVLAATFPALALLRDRIENWSEYDSFFVTLKESGWEASKILIYNVYLVGGTIIFITAVLPLLTLYIIFYIFTFILSMFAYPVRIVNKQLTKIKTLVQPAWFDKGYNRSLYKFFKEENDIDYCCFDRVQ